MKRILGHRAWMHCLQIDFLPSPPIISVYNSISLTEKILFYAVNTLSIFFCPLLFYNVWPYSSWEWPISMHIEGGWGGGILFSVHCLSNHRDFRKPLQIECKYFKGMMQEFCLKVNGHKSYIYHYRSGLWQNFINKPLFESYLF